MVAASNVGVNVAVGVGVFVANCGVGVNVAVGVSVLVAGRVAVGVGVSVFAKARVGVDVRVGVLVAGVVAVGVGVSVNVAVGTGVFVATWDVGVNVADATPPKVSTSCGALAPDSRLATLIAVELRLVTPRLKVPSPFMNALTSRLTQTPVAKAPEEPNWLPRTGALA